MLGKYWSIFLLAGLGVSALTDPRRSTYFRSSAPYLTTAIALALFAPHLVWVVTHGGTTFTYALATHLATFAQAAESALIFLLSAVGYVAVPILLGLVATRPGWSAIGDTFWPAATERRFLVIAFVAPLLLAALAAVPSRNEISPLWSISAMTLLPVVLLSSPQLVVIRSAAVHLLAVAVCFPLLMLMLSPAISVGIHLAGSHDYQAHYRLIAQAVTRVWQEHTDEPLRIVGGYRNVVDGTNFYFAGRPLTYDINEPARTPWVDAARIKHDGMAIVCPAREADCVRAMKTYATAAGADVEAVTLSRRYFGIADTPVDYQIVALRPMRD